MLGGDPDERFERLIEEGYQQFLGRLSEAANEVFLNIPDLEGVLSGAGMAKNSFVERGDLDYRLQEKIIDFVDVGYTGDEGLRETLIKVQDN